MVLPPEYTEFWETARSLAMNKKDSVIPRGESDVHASYEKNHHDLGQRPKDQQWLVTARAERLGRCGMIDKPSSSLVGLSPVRSVIYK
jgi:hypothetical protein